MKGSVATRFGASGYDPFAGTPIYKPSGFPTARMTIGFEISAQF
ncbi:peptide transporter [Burkholderia multivorans]|nr:peptide transporter [Burkholderia multivorans]MBR7921141.1 peptide transporter [Burkholderia multivorans]MBR8104773.1 peptide transporter [Burkholderia multivorans]MBR8121828.1 peptide transporter [Burkholderia multivorans]MBR8241762.1 peptide transporter [Burkholderia multivorans]MBR8337642.1 peptide transporter [Burkholderia multivorans]